MYDPNKDQEEMLRKIVASQMVAPDMVAPPMEAPTAPAMDVGAIVPPPPTFNVNESPTIDQLLSNFAQNYSGPDAITPAQMGPVHRGGGMMNLNAPPMAAYGQGMMGVTQDEEKDGLLNRLLAQFKSQGGASA
tara:strand:+ start:969 stop:1367 length:399 start_codon:yes stop_codon:yes gene_type:complete